MISAIAVKICKYSAVKTNVKYGYLKRMSFLSRFLILISIINKKIFSAYAHIAGIGYIEASSNIM